MWYYNTIGALCQNIQSEFDRRSLMSIFKRISAVVLATAIVFGTVGCDKTQNKKKEESNDKVNNTPIAMSEDFEITSEDKKLYDDLFSAKSDIKIRIDIPEKELKKIQTDYEHYSSFGSKSPIYRMCTLYIEIEGKEYVLEEVGIRMKGNTSRRDFYDKSTGEVYNLIHFKISFQETFDDEKYYGSDAKVWTDEEARKERKDRTFASLEGLELKFNRNVDTTYMRETYAYKMYRDFGVLAPNNTLGRLEVNDVSWGLYKIYEPVDKVFIKRYFDKEDRDGDLYKCAWAGWNNAGYTTTNLSVGIENEDECKFYAYDLKTNKKTSDFSSIKNLIKVVGRKNVTKEEIEEVLDIDNWLRFMAVSYFLGMPDDIRNNYNNHYVYFKSSTGQAVFIAYDCEISLGIGTWNPTGNYMTDTNPFSGWAYGINEKQKNPLIKKTVSSDGMYVDEFRQVLDSVAKSKWMRFNTYEVMFGEYYTKYAKHAVPDLNLKKFHEEYLVMNIDDTYDDGKKSNGNMNVKEYLSRMVDCYYAHRDVE